MPAITNRSARPAAGPPFPGLYFETPESIACIYRFVSAVPGCNPNTVTAVPKGGSRTIAIVDAYHAPNALADLTTFCLQFGLPVPTNFQVVYAASNGSVTTTPPPYDPGWEVEISLDVQWAHAMAPNARIILVEAVSNAGTDLLGAVKLANNLVAAAGGGEISMSWGSAEFSSESSVRLHLLCHARHRVFRGDRRQPRDGMAVGLGQCGRRRRHQRVARPFERRFHRRGGMG